MATYIRSLTSDRSNLPLEQAIDQYLANSVLEGKSSQTMIWHRKELTAFTAFLRGSARLGKVSDLTLDDGRDFVKGLMDRKTKYPHHVHRQQVDGGLAPQTIGGFVRSLRAFAAWLSQFMAVFHVLKKAQFSLYGLQKLSRQFFSFKMPTTTASATEVP